MAGEACEGQTWSLCWQAAVGRDFCIAPALVDRIRGRLIAAHEREGRVLIDFVLLPNEIHSVTQLRPGDSVSAVARSFGTVVSRWVRGLQPHRGPVLAGAYCALRLESDAAVRQEIKMLAWRPVFLGVSSRRNQYRHAALRYALGLRPARGFDTVPLLQYFGERTNVARAELGRWLAKRPSNEDWRMWELTRGLQLASDNNGPPPFLAKRSAVPRPHSSPQVVVTGSRAPCKSSRPGSPPRSVRPCESTCTPAQARWYPEGALW